MIRTTFISFGLHVLLLGLLLGASLIQPKPKVKWPDRRQIVKVAVMDPSMFRPRAGLPSVSMKSGAPSSKTPAPAPKAVVTTPAPPKVSTPAPTPVPEKTIARPAKKTSTPKKATPESKSEKTPAPKSTPAKTPEKTPKKPEKTPEKTPAKTPEKAGAGEGSKSTAKSADKTPAAAGTASEKTADPSKQGPGGLGIKPPSWYTPGPDDGREAVTFPDTVFTDFDYYYDMARRKIKPNFTVPKHLRNSGISCVIGITLMADGRMENIHVVQSAGDPMLDGYALRALQVTHSLPPLPDTIKVDQVDLMIQFKFDPDSF
jgi:TonB family protein